MEVTVKTLDSQTKTFRVASEITVKGFKEKITEEMGIPIEKQRLIFQGKVLLDEKPLQEYRVDGCVVHLVEKQPPRSARSNEQNTETTTSSTSGTNNGNMFMGAFALPVDVMGVTQQIVQRIIQQIGAESAQANISTSSSDDGSSVNVHINLSTVMSRNDATSRLAPAREHLNNVSSIITRLQNDGMLPNNNMDEDMSSTSGRRPQGEPESHVESTPEDLADVLQEVVRLNNEIRPHLERYQELLRSSSRQLRPGDDSLPDLTAEALHSLSHAYHALSDLTTNFRVPEPRLNVLPSISFVPTNTSQANARSGITTSQSQPTTSRPGPAGSSQATTGSGTSAGGTGAAARRSVIVNRNGLFTGGGGINSGGSFTGGTPISASQQPVTTGSPNPGTGSRPQNAQQQQPFLGIPLNLRNLPNLAVQFNPAAGNITIAHIMTTAAIDENSLRAPTTTTNSTPAPRTSSQESLQGPSGGQPATNDPASQDTEPMDQSPPGPTSSSTAPTSSSSSNATSSGGSQGNVGGQSMPPPSSGVRTSVVNLRPPNVGSASSSPSSGPSHGNVGGQSMPPRSNGGRTTVLNFPPSNVGHRDPMLPCQSFHFTSFNQRANVAASGRPSTMEQLDRRVEQPPSSEQDQQQPQQQQEQQQGQQQQAPEQRQAPQQQQQTQSSAPNPLPVFGANDVPSSAVLQQLLSIGQRAAAEAVASIPGSQQGPNPFFELFIPPPSNTRQQARLPTDGSSDLVFEFASQVAESHRNTIPEEHTARPAARNSASREGQGTLSRFLHCICETFPMQQMLLSFMGGTMEPYRLTRDVTRTFLRDDILRGAEPTPENLQRATEEILEELQKTFETSFAQCNVKDGIDAPATLLTCLRPKVRRILEIVNSSEPDSTYESEMASVLSRCAVEVIALTEYCLEDGVTGLEAAVRTSLGNAVAISELQPGMRQLAIDATWACVRDWRSTVTTRESAGLTAFVVRKEKLKPEPKEPKEPSPKPPRKEMKSNVSSSVGGASGAGNSSWMPNKTSSKSEEVAMDTDEDWKKVIPPEWVPVISQDIIRQRRLPRQAPFSDAYINGMPSKRRKIMESKEPAPYNQCVSATLRRSIAKAGVTPKTDIEKVNKEADGSPLLEKVFEEEVKNEVRERLSRDTDYNSDRFPSIHSYFEKDGNS